MFVFCLDTLVPMISALVSLLFTVGSWFRSAPPSVDFNRWHRYFRVGLSLALPRDTGEPRSRGASVENAEG
jgi:hypothetical protein